MVAKKNEAKDVAQLLTEPSTVSAAFEAADVFLARTASPTALAALRGERQSPPLLGTLAEGLQEDAAGVKPGIGATPPGKTYDHFVDPPVAVGLLSGVTADLRVSAAGHTTVKDSARAWRVDGAHARLGRGEAQPLDRGARLVVPRARRRQHGAAHRDRRDQRAALRGRPRSAGDRRARGRARGRPARRLQRRR